MVLRRSFQWDSKDATWMAVAAAAAGIVTSSVLIMYQKNRIQQRPSGSTNYGERSASENMEEDKTTTSKTSDFQLQDNIKIIQSILQYWFGQAPPDVNQKNLWMIQDPKRLKKVDKEIFEKFCSTMLELSLEGNSRCNNWCQNSEIYGFQGKLAAIVVLDQFSRHIHRYSKENSISDSVSLPDQKVLDRRALETAELFVKDHASEMDAGMIPISMYIFALLPFRHASQLETVQFVHSQIETKLAPLVEQSDSMVKRFRKATNRRLAVLQDDARRSGGSADGDGGSSKADFSEMEILETTPFGADLSATKSHILHTTITKFLAERGILPQINQTGHKSCQTICTPIIISLSGGVDSMVIAAVLADLVRSHGYATSMKVVAVHIDYANRPESVAEAAFVERWCEQQQIDFYCRRIDEVTRGITQRDAYELISRDVRYSFYQEMIRQYKESLDQDIDIGVVLGHHRGDLRENVLSNAHKGCGPLDLSGMTPISTNSGVTLLRPLLPLEKNEVFDYSHKFGVPYFKDTTPHWSTRGKIRNKLIPLLQEIYGEGCLNNLSQLAVESDQCRALVHSVSLKPFLEAVERKLMGLKFATRPYKNYDLFFWKVVLREALHSAGLGMFSDKAIESFLGRVQVEKPKQGWLQCRKDYAVYLCSDSSVFVLFPKSFPWRKADQYHHSLADRVVACPTEQPVCVGPWLISVDRVDKSDYVKNDWDNMLEQKALGSMDDLLEGSFCYYLVVQAWPDKAGDFKGQPLVFRSFKKANRPRSWKGADLKIQDTLPLLGCDDLAHNTLKSLVDDQAKQNLLVKITYRLDGEKVGRDEASS